MQTKPYLTKLNTQPDSSRQGQAQEFGLWTSSMDYFNSNCVYSDTIKEWYNVGLWPLLEPWRVFEPTGGSPDVLHYIKYSSQGIGFDSIHFILLKWTIGRTWMRCYLVTEWAT